MRGQMGSNTAHGMSPFMLTVDGQNSTRAVQLEVNFRSDKTSRFSRALLTPHPLDYTLLGREAPLSYSLVHLAAHMERLPHSLPGAGVPGWDHPPDDRPSTPSSVSSEPARLERFTTMYALPAQPSALLPLSSTHDSAAPTRRTLDLDAPACEPTGSPYNFNSSDLSLVFSARTAARRASPTPPRQAAR